jgi:hypothetical protein
MMSLRLKHYAPVALVTFIASGVVVSRFYGQNQKADGDQDTCKVDITKPDPGANVGSNVNVDGKATIKAGTHLWVFAHRRGLAIWWPQGSGEAQIRKNEWSVLASIGGSEDRGATFEILAGVVDDAGNNTLNGWVHSSDQSGEYKGMRLPAFVSACGVPSQITVTKTH